MEQTPIECSEHEIFLELEELCSSTGYVHTLAFLSFRDNFIGYDDKLTNEIMAESYAPSRTIRSEFATLLGLMIKRPVSFVIPSPGETQKQIDRTEQLLSELHSCLGRPMRELLGRAIDAANSGVRPDENALFGRADVLREPIFYGGESAYNFQYSELALERYSKDNEWLFLNKGFRISDAYSVLIALSRLQTRKALEVLRALPVTVPASWTMLPACTFSLDELTTEAGVGVGTVNAVIEAFTIPTTPANQEFTSLGEFNLASAAPILRDSDGKFVALETYSLVESLYDSPFYWMAADENYRESAFKHRGQFTEEFVASRMECVFGKANVHRNVKLYDGLKLKGEIDVLVLFSDRAIIFQCKSKKLTLEARRGNDLRLKEDFKRAVQSSYDQGFLCGAAILNSSTKALSKSSINLNPDLKEVYLICVLSDHYPALTFQTREFLKPNDHAIIQPPLITDVFFVDVLAEMLSSPLRLLSYLHRRVNYGDRINSINELTILSYHIKNNLWIDDDTDMIVLPEDNSIILDTAMTVRREGLPGDATPQGILTRMDGTLVGRIVDEIEHRAEPGLIDLGFMLLTLSDHTIEDIDRRLNEISRLTRADGKLHDFTLGFKSSNTGLTVHCSMLPDERAAERLQQHCLLRKYVQQADSWFGLAVRVDDGLPKFGLNLRFPWTQSAQMDEATKDLQKAKISRPVGQRTKSPKTGRNDSCPCGSGKKYKRCCLKTFGGRKP